MSIESVVITGASGWIGRSTLAMVNNHYATLSRDTLNYSFTAKPIRLSTGERFHSEALDRLNEISQEVGVFIPLAFLNQDQVATRGETNFVEINRHLIGISEDFIRNRRPERVILISSGVVNLDNLDTAPSYSLYRSLKIEQELRLTDACSQSSSQIVVCRLYSISGSEMIRPSKYALGEFILKALTGQTITINGGASVHRKYCDVEALMQLLFAMKLDGPQTVISSSGELTNMRNLAETIVKTLKSTSQIRIEDCSSNSSMSNYYWPGNQMEQVAMREGVGLLNLSRQIEKTAAGIMRSQIRE
jgi:nucleoside-diphosphate-sugar epimerase